jgi:peptide/nickel transport system substrate-binding protein
MDKSRKIKKTMVVLTGTLLALALFILPTSAVEKNLVWASAAGITSLDPSVSYSTEMVYMHCFYETLIRLNPLGSKTYFKYVLATGMTASKDGLEYTFTLRKGVKFHDGTPFKADAVKASIDRTIDGISGASFIWNELKEIKIIDDYTVKFILKKPVPLPQLAASANAAYIMSPKAIDKDESWFNQGNEAGTGPYMLKNYKPGESLVMAKFNDYWGGWEGKHIENILVKFAQDPLTRLQMLKSGESLLVGTIPPESVPDIEKGEKTMIYRGQSFYNYMAFFNTARPPLNNVKVRKALAHAMPYGDIIKVGFPKSGVQARGPVPAGQFGYSTKVFQYEYNLQKAKQLLAEAGYPKGGFKLLLTYASENAAEAKFVPLIQAEYKKLGIDVQIQPLLWNAQWEKGKGNPKQAQDIFVLLWWPTYSDPYETLSTLLKDEGYKPLWNFAYYKNKAYENLIRKAYESAGLEPEKAFDMYVQAQNMIQKDCPVAWLVDAAFVTALSKRLKNFSLNPNYSGAIFFYDMYIE